MWRHARGIKAPWRLSVPRWSASAGASPAVAIFTAMPRACSVCPFADSLSFAPWRHEVFRAASLRPPLATDAHHPPEVVMDSKSEDSGGFRDDGDTRPGTRWVSAFALLRSGAGSAEGSSRTRWIAKGHPHVRSERWQGHGVDPADALPGAVAAPRRRRTGATGPRLRILLRPTSGFGSIPSGCAGDFREIRVLRRGRDRAA